MIASKYMKVISENKKAYFDYEILEKFEAGMELKGFEVKAIKSGRISINGAFTIIRNNQAWLINADIPPYQAANTPEGYDSKRNRRLLLNASEIQTLLGKTQEKNLTIVPLKVYLKRGLVKLGIGLARGKKKHDKREVIKKREWSRLRRSIEAG